MHNYHNLAARVSSTVSWNVDEAFVSEARRLPSFIHGDERSLSESDDSSSIVFEGIRGWIHNVVIAVDVPDHLLCGKVW